MTDFVTVRESNVEVWPSLLVLRDANALAVPVSRGGDQPALPILPGTGGSVV